MQPKNAQSWPQVFLALTLSLKRALESIFEFMSSFLFFRNLESTVLGWKNWPGWPRPPDSPNPTSDELGLIPVTKPSAVREIQFACPLIVRFFFTYVPTLLAQVTSYLVHPCHPPTLLTQGTYFFIFFKRFFFSPHGDRYYHKDKELHHHYAIVIRRKNCWRYRNDMKAHGLLVHLLSLCLCLS